MKKGLFLLITLALTACTIDSYEKGEGELSNVQADFVEAHTNADKKVDYVVTDEDQKIALTSALEASWIQTADSFYRAVLYYKKMEEQAEPVSMSSIPVVAQIPKAKMKKAMKTDPLKLESVWMSKNRKYLNASIYLKVGTTTDEKAIHHLAIISDTLMVNADNTKTLHLRLFHDQGGVPEYYSQRSYFSISLKEMTADSVRLYVNTYDGETMKTFSVK